MPLNPGSKPADTRYEVRFSGSGGQGLITAAIIFAEAAGVYNGKYVCQTQSYGPEARGGKSKAEVVISAQPIDYPKAMQLDILLAMNQASCDAYYYDLKPNGLLVVDANLVEQHPTSRIIALPFTEIASEQAGRAVAANMVALGTIGELSGMVSIANLEKALLARVPKGTEEMNLKALHIGIHEAQKVNLYDLPRAVMMDEDEM
ncbi:MAG: 2-oxoacid:acceptor oxidoreductase family protein [Desulfobulbaceae bacterium]|nr:2-oxoacid:acceptor oxidoreductase family protein [Desulfobulbaceae bacterium]